MIQYEPEWLLFADNRTWGIVWGVILAGCAVFAIWRDRRRAKRTQADQLGCVPWMTVSIVLIFAAAAAFLFALKSH